MIKNHDNGKQKYQSITATLMYKDIELLHAYGYDENEARNNLTDEVKDLMISLIKTDWDEIMFVDGDGRPLSKFNNKG